jgi:hypothetical protein
MKDLIVKNEIQPIEDKDINFLAQSNHTMPVSIEGVARATLSTGEDQYVVIYNVCGQMKKMIINDNLYKALKLVFDNIKVMDEQILKQWAISSVIKDYKDGKFDVKK